MIAHGYWRLILSRLVGKEDNNDKTRRNHELEITYEAQERIRRTAFDSIMLLTHREPLRHQIRFLTRSTWFSPEDDTVRSGDFPVLIPDGMAAKLGISEIGH